MVFLWQLKEYRLDRMIAHLETPVGKRIIQNPLTIVKTILFIILLITLPMLIFSNTENLLTSGYLIFGLSLISFWLIWIIEALVYIKEIIKKGWLYPKFTIKAVFLLAVLMIIFIPNIIFGNLTFHLLSWGIILDRMFNPIIFLIVSFANIPSYFLKKLVIRNARRKIQKMRNLKIIGITGSYGKTSTKEFLRQMTGVKYNTLAPSGSINTEIGISSAILNQMNIRNELLIAEMGAYKKGEIKAMCNIVVPNLGIITGINQQHIQLFGSMDNIVRTKYELIENVASHGTAVFNIGNQFVTKMVDWAWEKRRDLTIWGYQIGPDKKIKEIEDRYFIYADQITVIQEKITFNIHHNHKKVICETKLYGLQNVENILACVCVCLSFGMSLELIKRQIRMLKPAGKTMNKTIGINNSVFIDDTFNANPDGVIAVLNYMKLYKGNKILLLTPLIELGDKSFEIHRMISQKAVEICDFILLTNSNYSEIFMSFAKLSKHKSKVFVVSSQSAIDLIKQNSDRGGITVFEGKESEKVLGILTKLD